MDLGLEGTAAIVCGASSGIGLAVARTLAGEGCALAMLARDADRLAAAAAPLEALAVAGDVRDRDAQRRLVDGTIEAYGRIDILVNNTAGPPPGTFETTPEDAFADAFELTMNSAVRLTRLALPHLRASGRGRIVNLSSWSVREPIPNLMLSNAIRPGLVGWAKTLAQEVGPAGITVNTIATGRVNTPRIRELWAARPDPAEAERVDTESIPVRRLADPSEVAAAVAFLCSAQAAYISGAVLPVDGGALRGVW
jgi:3-oxoacyl-[acyl-carrier protein] reductase